MQLIDAVLAVDRHSHNRKRGCLSENLPLKKIKVNKKLMINDHLFNITGIKVAA